MHEETVVRSQGSMRLAFCFMPGACGSRVDYMESETLRQGLAGAKTQSFWFLTLAQRQGSSMSHKTIQKKTHIGRAQMNR